jgi:hypothetical protein
VNNEGITKDEISLLLSNKQTDSVHPMEVIKDGTFLPRSKRHRRKKKWSLRRNP